MLPRGLTLRYPSFAEVNCEILPFRRGSSSVARLRLCVGARSPFHRQVLSSVVCWCTASLSQGRPRLRLYVGARPPFHRAGLVFGCTFVLLTMAI